MPFLTIASWTISAVISRRWSLNTKAVKAEMGEDWYDRHCRQNLVIALRVTVNRETLANIAA